MIFSLVNIYRLQGGQKKSADKSLHRGPSNSKIIYKLKYYAMSRLPIQLLQLMTSPPPCPLYDIHIHLGNQLLCHLFSKVTQPQSLMMEVCPLNIIHIHLGYLLGSTPKGGYPTSAAHEGSPSPVQKPPNNPDPQATNNESWVPVIWPPPASTGSCQTSTTNEVKPNVTTCLANYSSAHKDDRETCAQMPSPESPMRSVTMDELLGPGTPQCKVMPERDL